MYDPLPVYGYDQEEAIVWLEPPAALQYVREALVLCRFRARQPHSAPDSHLVAYATLRLDARPERTHRFVRRVWYALPDEDQGALPPDAVEPFGVRAGQVSPRAEDAAAGVNSARNCDEMTEMSSGPSRGATEPEAPGVAFRTKRVSVPRDPLGAALVLRRHFSPEELRELANAITSAGADIEQRQSA